MAHHQDIELEIILGNKKPVLLYALLNDSTLIDKMDKERDFTFQLISPNLTSSSPTPYDDVGALTFVVAVIVVYGISMFLLLATLAKRKSQSTEQDKEVIEFLNKMEDARKEGMRQQLNITRLQWPGNSIILRSQNRTLSYLHPNSPEEKQSQTTNMSSHKSEVNAYENILSKNKRSNIGPAPVLHDADACMTTFDASETKIELQRYLKRERFSTPTILEAVWEEDYTDQPLRKPKQPFLDQQEQYILTPSLQGDAYYQQSFQRSNLNPTSHTQNLPNQQCLAADIEITSEPTSSVIPAEPMCKDRQLNWHHQDTDAYYEFRQDTPYHDKVVEQISNGKGNRHQLLHNEQQQHYDNNRYETCREIEHQQQFHKIDLKQKYTNKYEDLSAYSANISKQPEFTSAEATASDVYSGCFNMHDELTAGIPEQYLCNDEFKRSGDVGPYIELQPLDKASCILQNEEIKAEAMETEQSKNQIYELHCKDNFLKIKNCIIGYDSTVCDNIVYDSESLRVWSSADSLNDTLDKSVESIDSDSSNLFDVEKGSRDPLLEKILKN